MSNLDNDIPAEPTSGSDETTSGPTEPSTESGWEWRTKLRWFAAEYLIVVLGVLTAVALNAWWVGLQQQELETQSLREIRDALQNDHEDILINIRVHERAARSASLLREHIRAQRPYTDTLDAHFASVLTFTLSVRDEAAYETLKQRGMETISNDSVRAAISNVYGVAYPSAMGPQLFARDFFRGQQIPYYQSHFKDIRYFQSATPNNYDALVRSDEYAAMLDLLRGNHSLVVSRLRRLDEAVTALTALLEQELANR